MNDEYMRHPLKKLFGVVSIVTVIGCSVLAPVAANEHSGRQTPQQTTSQEAIERVVGAVIAIDASAMRMEVETDTGEKITVLLNERVSYLRIPPGAETLEKADKISPADIKVGDRVYARGKMSADRKSMPARQVVVIAKSDIEQRHEKVRQEWRQRGVAGIITAIDAGKQEITLQVRGSEGARHLIIGVNQSTTFRRYAPDSIKFDDAKPGSMAELKVGDQLRALGNKSADGASLIGEEVVTGSFLTVGGTVTAVDVNTGELKIAIFKTQKPLTVSLGKDSSLRRIPPAMAAMFAQNAPAAGGGGGGSATAPSQAAAAGNPQTDNARPVNRTTDLQEAFDRLPSLKLADIKPGEMVVVSSTRGEDPSRVTAIAVIAGLDAVLRQAQAPNPARGRTPPNPNTGLPGGVLDFAITLP